MEIQMLNGLSSWLLGIRLNKTLTFRDQNERKNVMQGAKGIMINPYELKLLLFVVVIVPVFKLEMVNLNKMEKGFG